MRLLFGGLVCRVSNISKRYRSFLPFWELPGWRRQLWTQDCKTLFRVDTKVSKNFWGWPWWWRWVPAWPSKKSQVSQYHSANVGLRFAFISSEIQIKDSWQSAQNGENSLDVNVRGRRRPTVTLIARTLAPALCWKTKRRTGLDPAGCKSKLI